MELHFFAALEAQGIEGNRQPPLTADAMTGIAAQLSNTQSQATKIICNKGESALTPKYCKPKTRGNRQPPLTAAAMTGNAAHFPKPSHKDNV